MTHTTLQADQLSFICQHPLYFTSADCWQAAKTLYQLLRHQASVTHLQTWYQSLLTGRFGWFRSEHPQHSDWTGSLEALIAQHTSDNGFYRATARHLIETCHLEPTQFDQLVPQTASEKKRVRQSLELAALAQLTPLELPLTTAQQQVILTQATQLETVRQQQALAHYGIPQNLATLLSVYEYQRAHAASATFKAMPLDELFFIVCHDTFFSQDDQRQAQIALVERLYQHPSVDYSQTTLNRFARTLAFLNRGYFGWFEAERYIDHNHDFAGTPESWLMAHFDHKSIFRRAAGRLIARYQLNQVGLASYDHAQDQKKTLS